MDVECRSVTVDPESPTTSDLAEIPLSLECPDTPDKPGINSVDHDINMYNYT
jgi:hypothetical protein